MPEWIPPAFGGKLRKLIKIVIPIAPVTKKNSQRIVRAKGRYIPIPSQKYEMFERECGFYLEDYFGMSIDYPVNIKCIYYMPTRRTVDLVNLEEATLDVLVHYGVIKDDNCGIVLAMDGSRVVYDKKHPRTVIEISQI